MKFFRTIQVLRHAELQHYIAHESTALVLISDTEIDTPCVGKDWNFVVASSFQENDYNEDVFEALGADFDYFFYSSINYDRAKLLRADIDSMIDQVGPKHIVVSDPGGGTRAYTIAKYISERYYFAGMVNQRGIEDTALYKYLCRDRLFFLSYLVNTTMERDEASKILDRTRSRAALD